MSKNSNTTIEGKVADIVDEYTVVVNIGSTDGVKETHRFGIYTESDPIEDPETGEELGKIEYKISEVKPVRIEGDYSIMKTDETVGGLEVPIPNFKTRPKKLTTDPEFKHGDNNVSHQDKVKFLRDIEDEEENSD